jgi:hypothetical protein
MAIICSGKFSFAGGVQLEGHDDWVGGQANFEHDVGCHVNKILLDASLILFGDHPTTRTSPLTSKQDAGRHGTSIGYFFGSLA